MKRTAIYPGTFDPITNGHLDVIRRALKIFDNVIVAVAPSQKKQPLFSIPERLYLIGAAIEGLYGAKAEAFNGLLVDYASKKGTNIILRGLRAISDFEYEFQMAHMNRNLNSEIETVFVMPNEEYSFLTSSMIREVASFGGPVKSLVPPDVAVALREKFAEAYQRVTEDR